MCSEDSPKTGASGAPGEKKIHKKSDRPSQSALGEALRANLRRRKDQARARAEDGAGSGPGQVPNTEAKEAPAPKARES